MLDEIFSLNHFNIIEDNDNCYFIRALNNCDHQDIKSELVTSNGELVRIRTDRERYEGIPRYTEISTLTLEEILNIDDNE